MAKADQPQTINVHVMKQRGTEVEMLYEISKFSVKLN